MENLQQEGYEFEPVTLHRPMRLFKGSISQAKLYGTPFLPDPDFLVRLVSDFRSHKAMLRDGAGEHFKNLENYVRGKHQLSPITLLALSKKMDMTPEALAKRVHGNHGGHLVPEFLKLFLHVENLPYKFMSHALDTDVLCPCCKKNILDDREAFWEKQTLAFDQPEYVFAERILSATLGASVIGMFFAKQIGTKIGWEDIYTLSHRCKHPIGHWIANVQSSYGATSLSELAAKMQTMDAAECHVPYERLKKWSSGGDLMPVSVAKAVSKGSGQHNWFWPSFFLARSLSFVVDFLMAAAPRGEPKRQDVQMIVEARFMGLGQNLRIAMANKAKVTATKKNTANDLA